MNEARETHVDESLVHSPPINNTPLNLLLSLLALLHLLHIGTRNLPPHLVQTTPRRRARVLRVLRESHSPLDSIPPHLLQTILRQWLGVTESDVSLVRRRLGAQLVEQLGHSLALSARPLEDRRTASNGGVLLFDFGGAALGDQGSEVALEGEGDEIAIVEEAGEEVVRFWDLWDDEKVSWRCDDICH